MPVVDRLRVLFLAHAYPRHAGDPVGSFIHALAVALKDQGVDVTVVAPGAPGAPAHDVIDGVRIHRFRYAPRHYETLAYSGTMSAQAQSGFGGRLLMLAFLSAALLATARERRRTRADVIHAHWWFPAGLVARLLVMAGSTPVVVTMHGSDLRLALASRPGRRLFAVVARRAARMTAVSTWLARSAEEAVPGLSVEVAPMPVQTARFAPGGERDARRLLFVGKVTAQKGLDRLLRAMAAMRQPCTLAVVGAGRVNDHSVRKLAVELALDDRIEWLPMLSQDELAAQYRLASLLVIPALEEGLGLTAVEALLSETPVVAFASGGVTDLVEHGVTGLLVPAGDEPALATALDDLLADDARRAAMGRAGREASLRRFAAEVVAGRYAALYGDVIGR